MSISLLRLRLRLRRATLSLSSLFLHNPMSSPSSTPPLTPLNSNPILPSLVSQFRAFRASTISLAPPGNAYQNGPQIGPDDILFEGCDYNHWLITVDFPKDPRPTSEEMVETYVNIAAMIFGTPEEAKKKIYACSTTTYQGFQVECSEEVSKKFEGLPGVVFVLPDSYIDPVNKQYGGDKYENGIITPRPLPTQYGRTGGRFGDRNRDSNRPLRPRGEFNQGNPAYDNRGNTQGSAGNFGPPRHPAPQQNYGPPRVAPVNNSSSGQENYQGYGRDQMSRNQGNYNQGQRGKNAPHFTYTLVNIVEKNVSLVVWNPEEAKKKIYACSTTTYQGFQVECSEEVSKKFEGLPGVVFVLPDSYIDPVNKQYGGDKYENGIITPRPLPTQYGRTGGRFGDRNRDSNRPLRPRGEFNQGNPAYDNRGNTQGSAGNFGPPRHPAPQQNYGPPRVAPVNNSSSGQENYQGYGRDQMSRNQGNYNQGQRGNSYPQGPSVAPGNLTNNAPPSPQGGNFRQGAEGNYDQGVNGGYGHGAAGSYGQGAAGSYSQGAAGRYGQGDTGSYSQGASGSYGQGAAGSYGQGAGSYGQGAGGSYNQGAAGSYGQGITGNYGQGAAGNYGQGASGHFGQGAAGSFGQGPRVNVPDQKKFPNYGQPDSVHGENQRFSQGQQMYDVRQVQK